jgi:hypothetical protein
MASTQRRFISGTCRLSSNASHCMIAIPLLPENGAWAVFGTIIALRVDPPGESVTFFPTYAGYCTGGVATLNSSPAPPPREGGDTDKDSIVAGFAPNDMAFTVTGLQAEIAFTGDAEVSTIAWGWELEVVVMSVP